MISFRPIHHADGGTLLIDRDASSDVCLTATAGGVGDVASVRLKLFDRQCLDFAMELIKAVNPYDEQLKTIEKFVADLRVEHDESMARWRGLR